MTVQIHSYEYERKLRFSKPSFSFSEQIEVFNNGRLSSVDDSGCHSFGY